MVQMKDPKNEKSTQSYRLRKFFPNIRTPIFNCSDKS